MRCATAGRASVPLAAPQGLAFVDIDAESGVLPTAYGPRQLVEGFIDTIQPASGHHSGRCSLLHRDRRQRTANIPQALMATAASSREPRQPELWRAAASFNSPNIVLCTR